jgi:hypothetical protein
MAKPSVWRTFMQPVVIGALIFTSILFVGSIVVGVIVSQALAPAPRPGIIYEPDNIGRPYNIECDDGTGSCKMVVGGERITIGPDAISLAHWGPPNRDDLLVFGAAPERTWYASFPQGWQPNGAPRTCQWVVAHDTWDAGDAIIFAFPEPGEKTAALGFRLRKAPSWGEDWIVLAEDGRFPPYLQYWCLDRFGAVTSVFPGAGG